MPTDPKPKKKPEIISIRKKPAAGEASSERPPDLLADEASSSTAQQPVSAAQAPSTDQSLSQVASVAPHNSKRRQQAIERILNAVAHLVESNNLPDNATARSHAIIATAKQLFGSGISQTTLHKPEYLPLWHPDHYQRRQAVPAPAASTSSNEAPPPEASTANEAAPEQKLDSSTSSNAASPLEQAASQQQPASPDKIKPLSKDDIARRIGLRLWRKPDHPEFSQGLTMPELAKRWGIASFKIGQRRSTPKFQKWSHRCDPDGIIWEYRPAKQKNIPQFFPVDKAPKKPQPQPSSAKSGKPKPGKPKPEKPKLKHSQPEQSQQQHNLPTSAPRS
ncbi:MAG TPA: hypothetical protein V6D09_12295 [Leptolyngbyaceae cyanobacterium]